MRSNTCSFFAQKEMETKTLITTDDPRKRLSLFFRALFFDTLWGGFFSRENRVSRTACVGNDGFLFVSFLHFCSIHPTSPKTNTKKQSGDNPCRLVGAGVPGQLPIVPARFSSRRKSKNVSALNNVLPRLALSKS